MSATPSANLGFQNFFQATLTSDITSSSTDIPLDSIPNSTEGFLVIDPDSTTGREVIFYTSKTALKVVCPSVADGRGQDDTTAGAHLTGTTVIMAPVAAFWEAFQAGLSFTDNVINTSKLKTASDFLYDFVASGCVWSGDSYASTRNASMTAGVVYISGKRVTVSAVTARSFTASKDTYIDVDNTGTITYTEVANNAASPALTAGNIRIGIIVTGATTIAAAGSVNQGQEDKVLPIASSIPYAVTDSIGNLICPRDPNRRIIGYRQIIVDATTTTTADMPGLNLNCIIPTGRKVKVSGHIGAATSSVINGSVKMILVDVTAGATIAFGVGNTDASGDQTSVHPSAISSAGGTRNYKAQIENSGNPATAHGNGTATNPNYIIVELL